MGDEKSMSVDLWLRCPAAHGYRGPVPWWCSLLAVRVNFLHAVRSVGVTFTPVVVAVGCRLGWFCFKAEKNPNRVL